MLRPFVTGDMHPLPRGWKTGPPAFVGVASGKAGTSWWYTLLLAHPRVKPNRLREKELCYFYHYGYRGLDSEAISTYRQAFAAPEDSLCGEWSPGYLAFPLAVDYLAEAAPEAKILVIVRNPVDRFLSSLNQSLAVHTPFLGLRGDRAAVLRKFSLFPAAISHSRWYESSCRLLRLFDRKQLLVLQYEKCKNDPGIEIAKTYRFLGLDESFVPPNLPQRVNVRPYVVPRLRVEERVRLARYFADDVRAFAGLFPEIDLSLWPEFQESTR